MNDNPIFEVIQLIETSMATYWDEVCTSPNYAEHEIVLEIFLN